MWKRERPGCPVLVVRVLPREVSQTSLSGGDVQEVHLTIRTILSLSRTRSQGIDERILVIFEQQQQQRRRGRIPTVHPSIARIQVLALGHQGHPVGPAGDDDEGDGHSGLLAHLVGLLFHPVRVDHEEADSVSVDVTVYRTQRRKPEAEW
jgi:hypothetical protein